MLAGREQEHGDNEHLPPKPAKPQLLTELAEK